METGSRTVDEEAGIRPQDPRRLDRHAVCEARWHATDRPGRLGQAGVLYLGTHYSHETQD